MSHPGIFFQLDHKSYVITSILAAVRRPRQMPGFLDVPLRALLEKGYLPAA